MTAPVPPEPRPAGIRDTDPPDPPAEVLSRYGARVLDPTTAARLPDANGGFTVPPARTVYVGDALLVPAGRVPEVLALLNGDDSADLRPILPPGVNAVANDADLALVDEWRALEPEVVVQPAVEIRLRPADAGVPPPDAWPILLRLRAAAPDGMADVGLNHLMFSTDPVLNGTPGTQGFGGGDGPTQVDNGLAGRRPVSVLRPPEPVLPTAVNVAVLDTGLSHEHPLFTGRVLDIRQKNSALDPVIACPEGEKGDTAGPLDGRVDVAAGHGTFIAGIVAQLCPRAQIVPVQVMGSDGVALEKDVINALGALVGLMTSQGPGTPLVVPIIVLSMGTYTEQPRDKQGNPIRHEGNLFDVISKLVDRGVAVVAAAGNDATSRPLYPAAFASSWPKGAGGGVLSVGGLNLDGSVALFSNSAPWVRYWRCGVNVVSAFPTTFNGGLMPVVSTSDPVRPPRRGVDPDNPITGYVTWFGTSFSGPILAGELAQALATGATSAGPDDGATKAAPDVAPDRQTMADAIIGLPDAEPSKVTPLEDAVRPSTEQPPTSPPVEPPGPRADDDPHGPLVRDVIADRRRDDPTPAGVEP